jgi:Predicted hydrolases or acyltransferases (alpha/beta hydrolase superfamily)
MSQMVSLFDIDLMVEYAGNGEPIVFVHGFPLDHSMWRSQIDAFSQTHTVIAPDLRGFGQSEDSAGTVTMEQFADDIAAILEQLHVEGPITFCGLSMGGYIAWQFWKRHPKLLKRLILCDTRAIADSPEARQTRLDAAERVLSEGQQFLAESMIPKMFAPVTRERHPELVEETKRTILMNSPMGIAAAQKGLAARPDVTSWLPEIKVPALLIVGEKDEISPPDEMQTIADALPHGKLVVIPDAGHMAPLEQPQAVNDAIRQFLDESV